MSGRMQNFVQAGGRSGSPKIGQPTGRRAGAANLKVPVKPTILTHPEGQQNIAARRRSAGSLSHHQQHSQQRRLGEGQGVGYDRYDTDAESLDTTTHQRSVIQVADSQQTELQHNLQARSQNDIDSQDDSDEDEDDEDEEEPFQEDPEFQSAVREHNLQDLPIKDQVRQLESIGVVWDDGNSYPTTTSGPPEGFPNNWEADQELHAEGIRSDRGSSPAPDQLFAPRQVAHQFADPFHHQPGVDAQRKTRMPMKSSFMQRSAEIREHQRSSNVDLAVRGHPAFQSNEVQPSTGHLPSYSQATRYPETSGCAQPNPKLITQLRQSGPLSTPAPHIQAGRPTQPAASTAPTGGPRIQEQLVIQREPPEDMPVRSPDVDPVVDYDSPNLFDMTYDALKTEDFDTVPRGKPQVLSDDMVQKPLPERLAHVQKSLDAGDQTKFFRSLPTREWEEAGDWFLDQFSNIMQRMRGARQEKRKLARDFEDEVEKRYRHVAKRQQLVKDALDAMKKHGQGLIPRSPRASKSPRPV